MFKVHIALEKGGIQSFVDQVEAIAWVYRERDAIDVMLSGHGEATASSAIRAIRDAWDRLASVVGNNALLAQGLPGDLHAEAGIVTMGSPSGEALYHIFLEHGVDALEGAAYAADIPVQDLNWGKLDVIVGIEIYRQRMTSFNPVPMAVRNDVKDIQSQLDGLRQRFASAMGELEKLSAAAASGLATSASAVKTLSATIDSATADVNAHKIELQASLGDHFNTSTESLDALSSKANTIVQDASQALDDWRKSQMEYIRIAQPAELWGERKLLHEKSAKGYAIASIALGIAGTIATPFVSHYAFGSARSMLADAVPGSAEKASALAQAGIRPTLHFELIFAGATTLFWLTMFFWLMRILVRRYSSEQRLATDASGRSAMTSTYLGLIKEGAASDAERPIVLGALFQPISSQSANDDGPPATSMASIVAAIVAGKGG
ncbi:hypothetical protein [Sphingomonas sp. SORGH_AS_0879]|uniref:hypothetical protein n=1 Tax=Sphingomonas sp. SORGH_AS_0879 TaxID=3041790 RepID=UPI002780B7C5|nr:hypothetical protein [Sphingomonas sp. SORGH_AS_0879]MDQ1229289.1 outer membrane murein-binding lipoprotein Lpp [Sphingomonas sp. SORGH_AS_0879]